MPKWRHSRPWNIMGFQKCGLRNGSLLVSFLSSFRKKQGPDRCCLLCQDFHVGEGALMPGVLEGLGGLSRPREVARRSQARNKQLQDANKYLGWG